MYGKYPVCYIILQLFHVVAFLGLLFAPTRIMYVNVSSLILFSCFFGVTFFSRGYRIDKIRVLCVNMLFTWGNCTSGVFFTLGKVKVSFVLIKEDL